LGSGLLIKSWLRNLDLLARLPDECSGLVRTILTRGLYYKTLQIRNVRQMDRFISTGGPYISICTLPICNVFIVQAPGHYDKGDFLKMACTGFQ
jgi:hypothetical protein